VSQFLRKVAWFSMSTQQRLTTLFMDGPLA
jgi:hypothetical protein